MPGLPLSSAERPAHHDPVRPGDRRSHPTPARATIGPSSGAIVKTHEIDQ
jgi:hypothetical protein